MPAFTLAARVLALLAVPLALAATDTPKNAEYFIDGAVSLYLVDASRCSLDTHASGETYLIAGEQKLHALRSAMRSMPTDHIGGTLCGGPDKWLFIIDASGKMSARGIDGPALSGVVMPDPVKRLLDPGSASFLGVRVGWSYLADVPLDVPESAIIAEAADSPYVVLYLEAVREYHLEGRAIASTPAIVDLRASYSRDWPGHGYVAESDRNRQYEQWRVAAPRDVERWIDEHQLREILDHEDPIVDAGHTVCARGIAAEFRRRLYFREMPPVRAALAHEDPKGIVFVTSSELNERRKFSSSYRLFVVSRAEFNDSEAAKVTAALPHVSRVQSVCSVTSLFE